MRRYIIAAILLAICTGCSSFKGPERSTEPNLLTTANGVQLNRENNVFAVQSWTPGGLPIPMDHLMLTIDRAAKKSVPQAKISFDVPERPSLISKFNAYAAEKILSGKTFSPREERRKFILESCGEAAAPYITEYFRLQERKSLHIMTTAGLTNKADLQVIDFYNEKTLNAYQSCLEQAKKAAKNTAFAKNIQKELEFFLQCRTKIEADLEQIIPRFYPEKNETLTMHNLRSNTPAKLPTKIQCSYSADGSALILRMDAAEPEMEKRRITGTSRDYSNAWKDDRFEIFFVPDPSNMQSYYQFIITSGGVLWDGKREFAGERIEYLNWNSNAKLNVTHQKDRWNAELIIPLADLGIQTPAKGTSLFNIYRFRTVRGRPVESYAWSPILTGNNFQPERFGKIIWKEADKK